LHLSSAGGHRVRLEAPIYGWASIRSSAGIRILRKDPDAPAGVPNLRAEAEAYRNGHKADKYTTLAQISWLKNSLDGVKKQLLGSGTLPVPVPVPANRSNVNLTSVRESLKGNDTFVKLVKPFVNAELHQALGTKNKVDDKKVAKKTMDVAGQLVSDEVDKMEQSAKDVVRDVNAKDLQHKLDALNTAQQDIVYARAASVDSKQANSHNDTNL